MLRQLLKFQKESAYQAQLHHFLCDKHQVTWIFTQVLFQLVNKEEDFSQVLLLSNSFYKLHHRSLKLHSCLAKVHQTQFLFA